MTCPPPPLVHSLATPTFDRHLVRLRLTRPTIFGFEHGGVLRGLMSAALEQHELPLGLIPYASESGRVRFEPGDAYHLGLTLVGEDRSLADRIQRGLRDVGSRSPKGPQPVLGGNFVVEDWQTLPDVDLAAETNDLGEEADLVLLAPLRIKRPKELQERGAGYLNGECFPADWFLDLLWRRLFLAVHSRHPERDERAAAMPPLSSTLSATPGHLQWVDMPVHGTHRKGRPYTLGGVRGTVRLAGLSEPWRRALVLGRHLHVGQNIHYGLGRYEVRGGGDEIQLAFPPARSVLEEASEAGSLRAALARVMEAGGVQRNGDGASGSRLPDLDQLRSDLVEGRYRAGTAEAGSSSGPELEDRVASQAARQALAPAIETWLEDSSAAFRSGLSRKGATRSLEREWEHGFRYSIDIDLRELLELVDRPALFERLRALFPTEPLINLVDGWTRNPTRDARRPAERRDGLPRNCPVSPLLAKLCLDAFGEAARQEGLRLARLGDDFVLLTRDTEELRRRSLSCNSWLAGLDLASLRKLERSSSGKKAVRFRRVTLKTESQAEAPRNEPARLARPLFISGRDAKLVLHGDSMVTRPAGSEEMEIPISEVSHVILCGRTRAALPVLGSLARRGVSTFLCRPTGKLYATFGPHEDRWDLWLEQARFAENQDACRRFSTAVVAARLCNLAVLAVRFGLQQASEAATEICSIAEQCENETTRDGLRGLEGRGTELFWRAIAATLDDEWGFTGRKRRPPPDPVNAMLSFGYTLLHHHVSTSLVAAGLNPRIGLFHQPRGRHHALASDLTEELRHLVEAMVWTLIRRRQIRPERDFRPSPDGRYPCLLDHEPRRTLIDAFEHRLVTEFTPPDAEETMTYREFIARQARQVEALVAGRRQAYRPLVLER